MRSLMVVLLLGAMLLVGYLVARDILSDRGGNSAATVAIDKARAAREKAEKAGRDMEKRINEKLGERFAEPGTGDSDR